jgi:hypothetical protein
MPDRIDLHLKQHMKIKYLIIMNKRYSAVSLLNKLSSSYRLGLVSHLCILVVLVS